MAVDLDTVQELLEVVGPQEGRRLRVLHNAAVQTMREYKDAPGKSTLADWKAAEAELAAEVERLREARPEKAGATWSEFKETKNRAEVLRFLQRMGYQVAERTFYRHCDDGLCKVGTRGAYSRRTVKAYAENTLHLAGSGETAAASEENLLQARLKERLARERVNRRRDEIRLRRESGAVVDRETLNLEVAARAVALDAGVRQMVNARGMEWIVMVGGDSDKLSELAAAVLRDWDELINTYARADDFEVEFTDSESGSVSVSGSN